MSDNELDRLLAECDELCERADGTGRAVRADLVARCKALAGVR